MEPKHVNHLIHESSPYLLQHAHNPVDWYPWAKEAFDKARSENKPILLSIGYSACHWCHVMERESFEDEKIAALMNELFVNIKVDREERPDLDDIYMNAVQMLTGRGGWPMTVFLTPRGQPFYGGTYFPPEDRYGVPGFPRILVGVANAYRDKPDDINKSVKQIAAALERMSVSADSDRSFSDDIIAKSAEQLAQAYDQHHGGLGKAPKFPNVGVYELFLRHYRRSKDQRYLEMVTHTLKKMGNGGLYDHLGGGFHRYSVDEKWLVPHFEKMLYDNAQLVRIYAQVYCVTKDPFFKSVVDETMSYLLREMLHDEGGFYSTQDADSEGEEGRYFVWTSAEVSDILGEEAAEIFSRIYDVSEHGNFEKKNILHPILTVEQASKLFKREEREIVELIAEAKRKLFAAREQRIKPFRDDKILTSWNGLMLSGLAEAIKISPLSSYADAAKRTVNFFFSRMFRDGHLLHTYKDGNAKLLGYLDDYAFLATGLLDLYEATLDRSPFDHALQLVEILVREFWDDKDGAFFYTGRSHEELIARTKPVFDGSLPSGNAAATQILLRFYHYTANEQYLNKAEKVLRSYYDPMLNQPFGFAHLLGALDFYLEKPKEIVVIGNPGEQQLTDMLANIHALYLPNLTLQLASPDQSLEQLSPLLSGKKQINGRPTAYVCHNFTCSQPVTEWQDLNALLEA